MRNLCCSRRKVGEGKDEGIQAQSFKLNKKAKSQLGIILS